MGMLNEILGALIGESEEEKQLKEKFIYEYEKYQEDKKNLRWSNELSHRLHDSKHSDSRIDHVAQALTGWDRTFFMMSFGGPDARSIFEDAIAKLEEEAADSDPKVHLGVGMALTYYASRMLVKDEVPFYLQKIVNCYQKALEEDPKNGYYLSCLKHATREIVACGEEGVGKVSENGHSELVKASDLDPDFEYFFHKLQVKAALKEEEKQIEDIYHKYMQLRSKSTQSADVKDQVKMICRKYLGVMKKSSKDIRADDVKVWGSVVAVSIAVAVGFKALWR